MFFVANQDPDQLKLNQALHLFKEQFDYTGDFRSCDYNSKAAYREAWDRQIKDRNLAAVKLKGIRPKHLGNSLFVSMMVALSFEGSKGDIKYIQS